MHGFPKELGSDNGKELHNKLIENYLKENILYSKWYALKSSFSRRR